MGKSKEAKGPTNPFKLDFGGLTDVGAKRESNEDSILIAPDYNLFAVADGMGGHAAGEVASRTAIEALHEFIERIHSDANLTLPYESRRELSYEENVLYMAVAVANQRVCNKAEENIAAYGGMGTTLATLYFAQGKAHIGHVGDSRVYLYRDRELSMLTRDHSWVNEQLDRELITQEEAQNHYWRNVITRALGSRDEVQIDLKSVDPKERDVYLLCSDGLNTMVEDDAIAESLSQNVADLDLAAAELVQLANENGGFDNVSVVLVRVLPS